MEVTRQLARFVAGRKFADLPAEAVEVGKHCLLDILGVAIAGAEEPLVRILREQAEEEGGEPQASLLGGRARLTLQQAALVNGAAAHAHDYDDVHNAMSGHPTVPVAPAALALAEMQGASGRDLLLALVTGIDAECIAGRYVGPSHYARGFHATATLGTLGAAAASARLLALDEEQTTCALGIAATQAAGLKSMFGSMCKPFHAGRAAANGLLAAKLAARGFDSQAAALEIAQGFAVTHSDQPSVEAFERALHMGSFVPTVLFKYHAACYLTHSALEAAAHLRRTHGIDPGDIESVEITVASGHFSVCNIQEPATGLEAKFSLRLATAMVLSGIDTSSINEFTDAMARRADLVRLRDRTRVVAFPEAGHPESVVEIVLKDGRRLRQDWNVGVPESDLALQWNKLSAKFLSLVEPVLGSRTAQAIHATVAGLEDLPDVRPLMDLVRGEQ